jgi:hypothetical protein
MLDEFPVGIDFLSQSAFSVTGFPYYQLFIVANIFLVINILPAISQYSPSPS